MTSDSERKAAEDHVANLDTHIKCTSCGSSTEARAYRSYLAGRSSALKELEQIAREAFDKGFDFAMHIKKKTESKDRESALSELVADGEKNGEYESKEAGND
jgi:hypothetical protein